MANVLTEKELAFVQLGEEEGSSTEGIRAAADIYVERMFSTKERLTFSPENVPAKVQQKLLDMEGKRIKIQ